jgi:hypothetical protein
MNTNTENYAIEVAAAALIHELRSRGLKCVLVGSCMFYKHLKNKDYKVEDIDIILGELPDGTSHNDGWANPDVAQLLLDSIAGLESRVNYVDPQYIHFGIEVSSAKYLNYQVHFIHANFENKEILEKGYCEISDTVKFLSRNILSISDKHRKTLFDLARVREFDFDENKIKEGLPPYSPGSEFGEKLIEKLKPARNEVEKLNFDLFKHRAYEAYFETRLKHTKIISEVQKSISKKEFTEAQDQFKKNQKKSFINKLLTCAR